MRIQWWDIFFSPQIGLCTPPCQDRTVGQLFKGRSARQKGKHAHPHTQRKHFVNCTEWWEWELLLFGHAARCCAYTTGLSAPQSALGMQNSVLGRHTFALLHDSVGSSGTFACLRGLLFRFPCRPGSVLWADFPNTYFNGEGNWAQLMGTGPCDTILSCFVSFCFIFWMIWWMQQGALPAPQEEPWRTLFPLSSLAGRNLPCVGGDSYFFPSNSTRRPDDTILHGQLKTLQKSVSTV